MITTFHCDVTINFGPCPFRWWRSAVDGSITLHWFVTCRLFRGCTCLQGTPPASKYAHPSARSLQGTPPASHREGLAYVHTSAVIREEGITQQNMGCRILKEITDVFKCIIPNDSRGAGWLHPLPSLC